MMTKDGFEVNLNNIDSVKKFCFLAGKCAGDIDIASNDRRYVVDGKSIMGIFSLDLSKPVLVKCRDESDEKFLLASLGRILVIE